METFLVYVTQGNIHEEFYINARSAEEAIDIVKHRFGHQFSRWANYFV